MLYFYIDLIPPSIHSTASTSFAKLSKISSTKKNGTDQFEILDVYPGKRERARNRSSAARATRGKFEETPSAVSDAEERAKEFTGRNVPSCIIKYDKTRLNPTTHRNLIFPRKWIRRRRSPPSRVIRWTSCSPLQGANPSCMSFAFVRGLTHT